MIQYSGFDAMLSIDAMLRSLCSVQMLMRYSVIDAMFACLCNYAGVELMQCSGVDALFR